MSSSKVQRVCNACKYRCDSQSTTSFEQLPFSAFVIVSSFLPIASVASLSCVSKSVHRIFTSRDFDLSFWQYAWNRTQSKRSSPYVFLSHNMTVPHDELHLGIRDSNSLPTLEIETLYDTSAFRWRLKYMEDIAVFQSVGNALFFMQHPIVRFPSFLPLGPSTNSCDEKAPQRDMQEEQRGDGSDGKAGNYGFYDQVFATWKQ